MASFAALTAPEADSSTRVRDLDADVTALVDTWLDAEQGYNKLPSLVVSVVHGDKVVFSKGYGSADGAGKVKATPETVYGICSITKLFTSVALMRLVEEGKVRLDDPLTQYVPEFTPSTAATFKVPVTIRSVLMHAGGLPGPAVDVSWDAPYAFPTREELLGGLASQAMYDDALHRWHYSNLGMAIMGEVVARASGEPYARYVSETILQPLSLVHTSFNMPVALRGTGMAIGFSLRNRDGARIPLPPYDARGMQAALGLTSTVNDLTRFALWELRVLRTGNTEILRSATLRDMTRIQWTDPDGKTTWGLGFDVSQVGDEQQFGHSGWCPGYHSVVLSSPKNDTAVVAVMSSPEPAHPIAAQILSLERKILTDSPPCSTPHAADLSDYVGHYTSPEWFGEEYVGRWGDEIIVVALPTDNPAASSMIFRRVSEDHFRLVRADKSLGEDVVFTRDRRRHVIGMHREWGTTTVRRR